jgi:hypothetical protein
MTPEFTVLVLLYGDYPDLAVRCLGSVFKHIDRYAAADFRVGLNAVTGASRDYVDSLRESAAVKDRVTWYDNGERNELKYPMMRRMLYDPNRPVTTPYVVWFDDDSYIKPTEVDLPSAWSEAMTDADLLGSVYHAWLGGNQHDWVTRQPWYAGKPVPSRHVVTFCTGGWWVARYETLKRFDYPWPELRHRGGDVMLGELCRQQDLRMKVLPPGSALKGPVRINADAHGNESKAPKRGFDEHPIGWGPQCT